MNRKGSKLYKSLQSVDVDMDAINRIIDNILKNFNNGQYRIKKKHLKYIVKVIDYNPYSRNNIINYIFNEFILAKSEEKSLNSIIFLHYFINKTNEKFSIDLANKFKKELEKDANFLKKIACYSTYSEYIEGIFQKLILIEKIGFKLTNKSKEFFDNNFTNINSYINLYKSLVQIINKFFNRLSNCHDFLDSKKKLKIIETIEHQICFEIVRLLETIAIIEPSIINILHQTFQDELSIDLFTYIDKYYTLKRLAFNLKNLLQISQSKAITKIVEKIENTKFFKLSDNEIVILKEKLCNHRPSCFNIIHRNKYRSEACINNNQLLVILNDNTKLSSKSTEIKSFDVTNNEISYN